MGPHAAVAAIRHAVRPHLTDAVVLACSGGADSLALAAAVAFEAPRAGVRAGLVTVDHGLQTGSQLQARRVAAVGYELGFDPVEIVAVRVGTAGGPEAAARAARYEALDAAAQALDARVLLGHTLDDQAETVLLGLGRGSGPRSIAGMRVVTGRLIRPLLGVRRDTTEAACRALGLDWWDDPHNADPGFQRSRLRREALPLLEEILQGGVAEALARTASQLQDDEDYFATLTQASEHDRRATIAVADVEDLPRSLRTRALRAWALAAGATEMTGAHVAAVDALVTGWHGQSGVDLPGGVRVRRADGRLVLRGLRP